MKKKLSVFMVFVMVMVVIIHAENALGAATPQLNKSKAVMELDSKLTLKLNNIGDAKVIWSSSDKKVATVTSKGIVIAKDEGDATITAKCNKNKYICKVTVIDSSKLNDPPKMVHRSTKLYPLPANQRALLL